MWSDQATGPQDGEEARDVQVLEKLVWQPLAVWSHRDFAYGASEPDDRDVLGTTADLALLPTPPTTLQLRPRAI